MLCSLALGSQPRANGQLRASVAKEFTPQFIPRPQPIRRPGKVRFSTVTRSDVSLTKDVISCSLPSTQTSIPNCSIVHMKAAKLVDILCPHCREMRRWVCRGGGRVPLATCAPGAVSIEKYDPCKSVWA